MNRMELAAAGFLVGAVLLVLGGALRHSAGARLAPPPVGSGRRERQDAAIREAMVEYLAGNKDQTRLREFALNHRREVGEVLMEFQGAVAGSALAQLCDLALELALVHDWCQDLRSSAPPARRLACSRLSSVSSYEPCRRVAGDLLLAGLEDADRRVRLPAARALVQSGDIDAIGQVFHLAISGNLLIRILLTEDLRRYAVELCQQAVPEVLHSGDPREVVAALEISMAWERALPLADLHELLDHRNREIRMAALRLAPFVALSEANRTGILRALTDTDAEIGTVAALTAGRLKLQAAMPTLARLVRTGTAEVARIAAGALAEMPPRGWQTLEELAGRPNTSAAFIAGEALERARRRAGV